MGTMVLELWLLACVYCWINDTESCTGATVTWMLSTVCGCCHHQKELPIAAVIAHKRCLYEQFSWFNCTDDKHISISRAQKNFGWWIFRQVFVWVGSWLVGDVAAGLWKMSLMGVTGGCVECEGCHWWLYYLRGVIDEFEGCHSWLRRLSGLSLKYFKGVIAGWFWAR